MPCLNDSVGTVLVTALGSVFAIFPVKKEESAVPNDPAPERGAVLIANQILPRKSRTIAEPVVRGRYFVAMKFIQRSVIVVGSALSHQRNLPVPDPRPDRLQ